tara:strand:- start:431 stop:1162 length:732 start_codon:yes stop_codon:yes gene_type:complete
MPHFYSMEGFCPSSDTIIEVLHTILLGPVHYAAVCALQSKKKKEFLANHLERLSFRGIVNEITSRGLHHARSWEGREHRAFLQIAPMLFYFAHASDCAMITKMEVIFWCLLARASKIIYHFPTHLPIRDAASLLRHSIEEFIVFQWKYKVYTTFGTDDGHMKLKMHLLTQIADQVELFRSLTAISSERYELFNAPIRSHKTFTVFYPLSNFDNLLSSTCNQLSSIYCPLFIFCNMYYLTSTIY